MGGQRIVNNKSNQDKIKFTIIVKSIFIVIPK